MKKSILTSLVFLFIASSIDAQEVKRYLTFEHFTNTVCGICASKNPAFFTKIEQYPDDIHHIAYHPPVPYTTCALYQHNPSENAGRADYYDIFGTPRVFLYGSPTGSQLVTDQQLSDALNKTSPIGIAVTETLSGTREVSVSVKSFGTVPSGNYKLYVAIAEKIVDYSSPNGETQHHNVFRKFLANGTDLTPAANGDAVNSTYSYSIDSDWQADQIYVLAYLQNNDTDEVLNSGTRFDEALPTSSKDLEKANFQVQVSPNPASDQILIDLGNTRIEADATIQLMDVNGHSLWSSSTVAATQTLDVKSFPAGLYLLSVRNGQTQSVEKVLLR